MQSARSCGRCIGQNLSFVGSFADAVLDALSCSAGPLPECQLSVFRQAKPVWVCHGKDDPWTPAGQVEALRQVYPAAERVEIFEGVGQGVNVLSCLCFVFIWVNVSHSHWICPCSIVSQPPPQWSTRVGQSTALQILGSFERWWHQKGKWVRGRKTIFCKVNCTSLILMWAKNLLWLSNYNRSVSPMCHLWLVWNFCCWDQLTLWTCCGLEMWHPCITFLLVGWKRMSTWACQNTKDVNINEQHDPSNGSECVWDGLLLLCWHRWDWVS